MIWTDNIHNLVDDMVKEVYKNLNNPRGRNCVIRTAYKKMTLQECQEVVGYFQERGFEATWYQKDDIKPIIIVSWGIPYGIDEIDTMYKNGIKIAGNNIHRVVELLAEYIDYVYIYSRKSACVIPFEHLDYICGASLTYRVFVNALQKAEEYYSLKVRTGTFNEEDLETEFITIQKKIK